MDKGLVSVSVVIRWFGNQQHHCLSHQGGQNPLQYEAIFLSFSRACYKNLRVGAIDYIL